MLLPCVRRYLTRSGREQLRMGPRLRRPHVAPREAILRPHQLGPPPVHLLLEHTPHSRYMTLPPRHEARLTLRRVVAGKLESAEAGRALHSRRRDGDVSLFPSTFSPLLLTLQHASLTPHRTPSSGAGSRR